MSDTLLHSRFSNVATNTIDYWMKPDSPGLEPDDVLGTLRAAHWLPRSTLQLYLHVPYCAQKCSFCAFSGGNSLNFKTAERYADLLVWQMHAYLDMCGAREKNIASINIGGGSPDLLRGAIKRVLKAARDLPGCSDRTEISVEFTLSTADDTFLDSLIEFGVTKASFGVQAIDPGIRRYLQMPGALRNMDQICRKLAGDIPVINVDLITGLPGQTVTTVARDLHHFIEYPFVNSISTYLLTPGAAPKLVADTESHAIPPFPRQSEQALMRLHSYTSLLRDGWVRKGTNTYMAPSRIPADVLELVAGNECIGARRYEDFLLGCGAQAVSSAPGVRIENTVDIDAWMTAAEQGEHSLCLEKCSLEHQRDMALWVFPLMADGLDKGEFDAMLASGAIDQHQTQTFDAFIEEGLIIEDSARYRLSVIGEVFMGHLVRLLKKPEDQAVIAGYLAEGYQLGKMLNDKRIPRNNAANDRQRFKAMVTLEERKP
ncbi:radical SAM protein [Pandoraea cepalis]|nr:radical SAM protein [Pandoraea cepalis]